jgi:hypothetical protein
MLIPRFSIRWLLGLTTFSAGISLVLSYAVRNHAWAIGVMSALWTFVVAGVFYALAFLAAWWVNRMNEGRRPKQGESPFAGAKAESCFPANPSIADSPPPMMG